MDREEFIEGFVKAVALMKEGKEGTWFYWLDRDEKDNDWAIVVGWQDGYEEDPEDDCTDGSWRLCAKVAYQPWNSVMQCDYDIDWTMPYDEETGEVDDVEMSIYQDSDLRGIAEWLLDCYATYESCFEEANIWISM